MGFRYLWLSACPRFLDLVLRCIFVSPNYRLDTNPGVPLLSIGSSYGRNHMGAIITAEPRKKEVAS
jgi:hypothetical protein